MLHRNRCLMQAHPLVQQCWDNLQDAQSCSPAAGVHYLFSWTRHIWTHCHKKKQPLCVSACVVWEEKAFKIRFLEANKTFCQFLHLRPVFFHLLHYCLLVFSSFLFSQGHLFSVCVHRPSPTSSYFTWCDSEV